MGIIALPTLFALLLFWIPGLGLADIAMRASDDKASSTGLFVFVVLVAFLIGFVGPIMMLHGTKIYVWSLFFKIFLRDFFGTLILGCASMIAYRFTRINVYRIIAASIFTAAGLVPVGWFILLRPLAAFFKVELGA